MITWDLLALVLFPVLLIAVVSVGRSLRRTLHHAHPAEAVLALIDDDGEGSRPE